MTSTAMYELSGAELDAVAAGAPPADVIAAAGGLVAIAAAVNDVIDIGVLNIDVDILNDNQVIIRNVLNNNTVQVGLGAAVAILGGAAGGLVRQLA